MDELEGKSCEKLQPIHSYQSRVEEGQNHLLELSKLAEKDPEFYKYLQENDKELLDFDPDNAQELEDDVASEDEDIEMAEAKSPALTTQILRKWQKALLEVGSITIDSLSSLSC